MGSVEPDRISRWCGVTVTHVVLHDTVCCMVVPQTWTGERLQIMRLQQHRGNPAALQRRALCNAGEGTICSNIQSAAGFHTSTDCMCLRPPAVGVTGLSFVWLAGGAQAI